MHGTKFKKCRRVNGEASLPVLSPSCILGLPEVLVGGGTVPSIPASLEWMLKPRDFERRPEVVLVEARLAVPTLCCTAWSEEDPALLCPVMWGP